MGPTRRLQTPLTKKSLKKQVPARLFMIVARDAPTAVIFRRGPSEWVQLIKWNTQTDAFELGQWFHGRIYEHRADLSPDGSLLIYFAMKNSSRALQDRQTKEFTYFWTAISKPPYFTALALWPKYGSWGGGGLFKSNNSIFLNHEKEVAEAHPSHKPGSLEVILKDGGCGGDEPIFSERLERDGWILRQEWKGESRTTPSYQFRTVQPEIREKANGPQLIRLIRSKKFHDFSDEFAVVSGEGKMVTSVDRAGWVDWDQQGRLVFVRDGRIFSGRIEADGRLAEHQLSDLNSSKPSPLAPPKWATTW